MSTPAKLAVYGAALAIVFAGAAVAGTAIGDGDPAPAPTGGHGNDQAPAHAAAQEGTPHPVRGLAIADGELRLALDTPEVPRGREAEIRFRIVGEDGAALRDFDVEHEKRMHLILARRDLTGFQHLHPAQRDDGAWTAEARLPEAGSYRVFADFSHGGDPYTLAADLRVDGAADLQDLPPSEPLADAGDGYEVRIDAGATPAGRPANLSFVVHRDGRAVQTEPYLGAGGHLVALREGDLAFLHVHPEEHGRAGSPDTVAFEATFPTPGRYRLFLQFRHDGEVRTAAFTREVS